jgi:type III restriction enzyme
VFEQEELAEVYRVRLKLEFATTKTEVSQVDIGAGELPPPRKLLESITNKVIDRAKLPSRFSELYPAVRDYVATRCFGQKVDLESDAIRSHLSRLEIQEGIAKYLAREIAELTIDRRAVEFERADYRLSETKPFSWRRNLPPLVAKKTIFNYVATYNDFERRFAEFLAKKAADVLRFAALGTTKGRVWEGTTAKDEAIREWCERVSEASGADWRYMRVNQTEFDSSGANALGNLIDDP